jgi:hypothetical protein
VKMIRLSLLCVASVLLVPSLSSMATKDQTPPTTTFTIQSVSLSGDTCLLSAKSAYGVTYYATGWARQCQYMRTGDTQTGYVKTRFSLVGSNTTELYFQNGLSKKGKVIWNWFTVSSQSQ